MKFFITGGTGFLGKSLIEALRPHPITLYKRGDDLDQILTTNPDVIIHAAAEIYKEELMFDSNIGLTYDLLEAAYKTPDLKAFIYIGSSSEYGPSKKNHPLRETDYLEPTTMYEATKGAGSLLTLAFAAKGVPAMVVRPFSLYGKHEPQHRFIPTAIRAAKNEGEMYLAPGSHDFIYIDDFIDGIKRLIEKPRPGEVYHFGSGVSLDNDEALGIIEEVVGKKTKRVPVAKMRSYDTSLWLANIEKAQSLGWQPQTTFRQGIEKLCLT